MVKTREGSGMREDKAIADFVFRNENVIESESMPDDRPFEL
jgi:hypothetical protein